MIFFGILVAFVVVVLLVFLTGADYHVRRILAFQRLRKRGFHVPSLMSLLSDTDQEKQPVPLSDVRDLVISLQLGTSLDSTLTGSIARAAGQFENRGALGERLNRHVEARLGSVGPHAVIEGLVNDFDCLQLEEVLDRLHMAEDGGVSYTQVLAVSAVSIEEDIRAAIEKEIQRAPTLLTLPMVAGVFFPAIVLGLLPLLGSALTAMRGR